MKRFQNEEVVQLMQYHQTHVVNVSMGLKYAAMEYFFDGDDEKRSWESRHRESWRNTMG